LELHTYKFVNRSKVMNMDTVPEMSVTTNTMAVKTTKCIYIYDDDGDNSLLFMCRVNSHKANYRHSTV
jgi:hypothetical protein